MSNPDLALAESVSTTNASYFIFVYILVLIYCCFGLAVVCDVYFVPALQKLSITYDLPPDIAGSTLMALGASVPELFASLIGVFITEDDIGTGSIIGSSCFNLIAVPAACAFVAAASFSREIKVKPMPVTRNSAFYAITILVLVLIIKDNKVDIPESIILLLFFVMYMAFMIFSAQTQHRKQRDSLQISTKDSYISSTDSAITDSCNSSNSSLKTRKDIKSDAIEEQIKQNNRGKNDFKYYFEPEPISYNYRPVIADLSKLNANDHIVGRRSLDERTPLNSVSLNKGPMLNKDGYSTITMMHNNYPIQANKSRSSYQNLDSKSGKSNDAIRLNLGMLSKDSANLIIQQNAQKRDYNDVTMNIDLDPNQDHVKSNPIGGKRFELITNGQREILELENHNSKWVSSRWIQVPMLPLTLSMRLLMPYKFKSTCWTIWTFLISIIVIGGLTYVSVWMVHSLSQCLGIPEVVAGMTILSWGTGIPELIASIVLIRKTAEADMAISNTIGSNVIDISFCLSLPWIVKCFINKSFDLEPVVEIQSIALPWTSLLLVVSVVLLLIILKLHDWSLCLSVGIWLSMVYVAFVFSAILLEYSIGDEGVDWLVIFKEYFSSY